MSKAARDWAHRQKIADGTMKPILMELGYLHMDGKSLFPSQAYLAQATGASVRSVRDALRLLEHFQIISRQPRSSGAGGRTSDVYTLALAENFTLPKRVISTARKALCNRRNLPLGASNSQPAKSAGPPGEICRGIGDEQKTLSHVRQDVGIGHYVRGPALKVVRGGLS